MRTKVRKSIGKKVKLRTMTITLVGTSPLGVPEMGTWEVRRG